MASNCRTSSPMCAMGATDSRCARVSMRVVPKSDYAPQLGELSRRHMELLDRVLELERVTLAVKHPDSEFAALLRLQRLEEHVGRLLGRSNQPSPGPYFERRWFQLETRIRKLEHNSSPAALAELKADVSDFHARLLDNDAVLLDVLATLAALFGREP